MLAASTIWGLSPIYYKLLADVPPLEVLAHRTLWSFVTFFAIVALQGRVKTLLRALASRRTILVVAAAGLMISINWFVFILSIQIGHAVEASLGYYVFPLVAVAFGTLFFGEKLGPRRVIAVLLAALAVATLSFGLGAPPWISLILASSFGLYGLIKKSLDLPALLSVTGEVTLLLPFALVWLWGTNFDGWVGFTGRAGGHFGHDVYVTLLLALSGFLTAGPLILFSYATRRLPLSSVGLIQYLNPTLQFLVATLVFGEAFSRWHAMAFGLIWAALALYSWSGLRQEKSAVNLSVSSGTSVTTDT